MNYFRAVLSFPFIVIGMFLLFFGVIIRYGNIEFTTEYFNRIAYLTRELRIKYESS